MQSNFTNDDLEQFLRQSADSCRMRPSEDVWKGISKSLTEQKRRVRFATGAFLMAASLLGFFLIDSSKTVTRTVASASAEVNNSNAYASPEAATGSTLSPDQAFTAKKQRPAPVRNINTAPRFLHDQPAAGTAGAAVSDDAPVTTIAAAKPAKELAPVVPLFNSGELASALEGQTIAPPPVALSEKLQEAAVANTSVAEATKEERQLLSIENVTSVFRALRSKNRFSFEFFFTPTVSYRKLSENKAYLRAGSGSPTAAVNLASFYSVNSAVTHKPDIGLELGFAAKYPVAKNVKIKGGLQFNMNRYDIKAFTYTPEVATIALNTGGSRVSYVGSVTPYRNFGGNSTDWLQNLYFQASAPIGVEVMLPSKKPVRFGISSTLQPTYILGDRAYLISSDYKNYTEVPWLTRKWNVNTNLETFVSYSTGKMNWHVGPQVRYQLLSSFMTKYPVKENLFDFGMKVGVSINKTTNK